MNQQSATRKWTGWVLSGIVILFLIFDAGIKIIQHPLAIQGTIELGYPAHSVLPMGIILATCLIFYVVPRTSVLGAILLTGYLGGAIATHVRVENPLFSHTLFPVYVAVILWVGLGLRDKRVRTLMGSIHQ